MSKLPFFFKFWVELSPEKKTIDPLAMFVFDKVSLRGFAKITNVKFPLFKLRPRWRKYLEGFLLLQWLALLLIDRESLKIGRRGLFLPQGLTLIGMTKFGYLDEYLEMPEPENLQFCFSQIATFSWGRY